MANKAKHAYGSRATLAAAIESGKVDAYDIIFLNGENERPAIGWIDKYGNPVIVECADTEEYVVKVDELPTTDGKEGIVYIYNNEAYIWDGNQCTSICKPTDVSALEAEIATKADAEEVEAKIKAALAEHIVKKYEILDVPAGTLVDYRTDEIRIMCPIGTEFTKQSVGAGGDANCYYATFKTYVSNDNVAGYIEHLGNQVDSEIQTEFSIDEHGRKYQVTWLALAKYDDATGWTYYGKNSSVNKYIGWDYQIDWYDADGKVIASDKVRINLSNEDCHNIVEPYYVGSIMNKVDTKIEEKIAEVEGAIEVIEF